MRARPRAGCAANVPNSGLLLLPEVSHFAFLQDPAGFTDSIEHFLAVVPWQ